MVPEAFESSLVKIGSVIINLEAASHRIVRREHVLSVDILNFNLTCDVIGGIKVKKVRFPSTNFAGHRRMQTC